MRRLAFPFSAASIDALSSLLTSLDFQIILSSKVIHSLALPSAVAIGFLGDKLKTFTGGQAKPMQGSAEPILSKCEVNLPSQVPNIKRLVVRNSEVGKCMHTCTNVIVQAELGL